MKKKLIFFLALLFSLFKLNSCYDCSSSIQEIISENEGVKKCVYIDSLGHPTIGIGFNLDRSDASEALKKLGLDYNSVRSGTVCLNDFQIASLFVMDLQKASDGVKSCVPKFNSFPECIQKVLLDMTFNMGPRSLCSWPNLIAQLNNQEFKEASENLRSSKWCSQVGDRCTRDATLLENSKKSFLALKLFDIGCTMYPKETCEDVPGCYWSDKYYNCYEDK